MPGSSGRSPFFPDIDPSVAIAQTTRADASARVYGPVAMSGSTRVLSAAIAIVGIIIAFSLLPGSPREATGIMERLTPKLQSAQRIPTETTNAVSAILARQYDCDQVTCDENLWKRNRLARARLKEVLGTSVAAALGD